MAAKQDPISGLNYGWALGEDNWNVGMDSNLIKLGATINISVLDFVSTPSVSTNGTRYIVASGSGAFAGQNNNLAVRVEDVWTFYTLPEGCVVYDEDTNAHYKFEGGSYSLLVDLSSYLTSATAASTYATITQAQTENFTIACSDRATAITTGTNKMSFRNVGARKLTSVRASLDTAGTSTATAIDINVNGTSIFTTTLSIDATEETSVTAQTPFVFKTSSHSGWSGSPNYQIDDDAKVSIDFDAVGTGAKGLDVAFLTRMV